MWITALIFGAVAITAGLLAESSGSMWTWLLAIVCSAWSALFAALAAERDNAMEAPDHW